MWFYHCISHHRTSFYFLSNNALGFTLSEFTISDPANYVNAFMHSLHGLVSQQVYFAWIGFCLLIFAQKQVGCFRLTEVYARLTNYWENCVRNILCCNILHRRYETITLGGPLPFMIYCRNLSGYNKEKIRCLITSLYEEIL